MQKFNSLKLTGFQIPQALLDFGAVIAIMAGRSFSFAPGGCWTGTMSGPARWIASILSEEILE